jgi:hypothetical protein
VAGVGAVGREVSDASLDLGWAVCSEDFLGVGGEVAASSWAVFGDLFEEEGAFAGVVRRCEFHYADIGADVLDQLGVGRSAARRDEARHQHGNSRQPLHRSTS